MAQRGTRPGPPALDHVLRSHVRRVRFHLLQRHRSTDHLNELDKTGSSSTDADVAPSSTMHPQQCTVKYCGTEAVL